MPTVVYDGDCGFCRQTVDWARRRDRGRFTYATAHAVRDELRARGLEERAVETVLLLDRHRAFDESAAVVRVLWGLRAGWPLVGGALWLVPKPLRDLGYRAVAARRGRLGHH